MMRNILLNFVCALIGFLFGNWLSIERDKRREFNDLINPIRGGLLVIRSNPSASLTGDWRITCLLIRERLHPWKRKAFDRAIENYIKSKSEDNRIPDGMFGFSYKNTKIIVHAANDLLKFLKPR